MRIETHRIFKVNAFATQVKMKLFFLKIHFQSIVSKVVFTHNIIFFRMHRSTPVGVAPSGSIVCKNRSNSLNELI